MEAENGSTLTKIPPKNILMRLWKPISANELRPPSTAFSFIPDNKKSKDDQPGHFYFRLVDVLSLESILCAVAEPKNQGGKMYFWRGKIRTICIKWLIFGHLFFQLGFKRGRASNLGENAPMYPCTRSQVLPLLMCAFGSMGDGYWG